MDVRTVVRPRVGRRGAIAAVLVVALAPSVASGSAQTSAKPTQSANVASAIALARAVAEGSADPLAVAVASVARATVIEAEAMGVELRETRSTAHILPSHALAALAARTGTVPTAAQRRSMRSLDHIAAPVRSALTGVVNAFLGFDAASWSAFAGADPARFAELRRQSLVDGPVTTLGSGTRALTDAGVDVGAVLAAREVLLREAVALRAAVQRTPMSGTRSTLNLCPAVAVDLTSGNDTYTADCALVIDTYGDDTYFNNAGGNTINAACSPAAASQGPAGALIDIDGNDQYVSGRGCGINGGGYEGAGFLLDTDGDDSYSARTFGTNGGGDLGLGMLVDSDGADAYNAVSRGTNGGANFGAGLLVDTDLSDSYNALNVGVNGGGKFGIGMLIDTQGDETYFGDAEAVNGGSQQGGATSSMSAAPTGTRRSATAAD